MEIQETKPARAFKVGLRGEVELSEMAKIRLASDEQVTFLTERGGEYDVARKSWGFYATPSLNGRLPRFGLRPVMVKNTQEQWFVLLVEKTAKAEKAFQQYCDSEQLQLVGWLDDEAVLAKLEAVSVGQCLCGRSDWQPLFHYDAPPAGETLFPFVTHDYQRDIMQCRACGHCRAVHSLPLKKLYGGGYMSSTYGEKIRQTYERIMSLPPEQSDNVGRVARLREWLGEGQGRRVLDVGSGLGVFLARMKEEDWDGTALDPDERAVTHAREVVGVTALQADWLSAEVGRHTFDLVTFNKVLEHIDDPVMFLAKAKSALAPGGNVYIEVPDGEAAALAGPNREEFFVEHWHVFSPLSLLYLIKQSGFTVRMMERLREPSGKYTLRALAITL